ncbi:MAG: thioredoxin fold domain-containing protein [bacterium]|nr:MAG: thioredoxin fold domain-containing protein [bacterium]
MEYKSKYIVLTDANFHKEVIESSRPMLVVCETDWCGACHIMAPIYELLSDHYKWKIKIGKLDFEDNEQIPRKYGIQDIPTLLFFKNGEIVDRITGTISRKNLETRLKDIL